MATRKKKYDRDTEIRAIARERVGTVKPTHAIEEKPLKKKPKHKKKAEAEAVE